MPMRSEIIGIGAYLPERILTNDDLAKMVDTSDSWIRERTGIVQRHQAAEGELTSDLAAKAAQMALDNAGKNITDIDQIIVATSTPDRTFPATAAYVQKKLGMTEGAAFDLQAVCSGFIYGLTVADSLIVKGVARSVLLIGAETMTRIVDFTDRNTCVLFGDGAGAVVLHGHEGAGTVHDSGVLSGYIRSNGLTDLLCVDGGVSLNAQAGHITMQGREVFRHAVKNITDAIKYVLADTGLSIDDIDWFVPHQANKRIIASVGKHVGLDENRVILTIDKHANTSAASIPLALHTGMTDGRIKKGDLVLFESMGAGFTWGACLIRM